MNVILPEKRNMFNKRNIIYLSILVICSIAVAIAVYQFFTEEKLSVILKIAKDENEEITQLQENFNNLFTNEF